MRRIVTLACLLMGGALILPGCGDDEAVAAGKKRAAAAKKKRARQEAAAKTAAAKKKADEEANIYAYTEKPLHDLIPNKPLVGRLFDSKWPIESVVFEPVGDTWTLTFHDVALPRPTAMARKSHPLTIELDGLPGPGVKFSKNLGVGGASWKVPPPPAAKPAKAKKKKKKKKLKKGQAAPASKAPATEAAPQGPTLWKSRSAYALEITAWEVQPFDEAGAAFQVAGKASGRIALVYEGSDGRPHAWVAGHFEDALVRFMGKPSVPHVAPASAPEPAPKKRGKAK